MHSNVRFRKLSDSDTAHLPETPMPQSCTTSRVLSLVYATERNRQNTTSRVPRARPLCVSFSQYGQRTVRLTSSCMRAASAHSRSRSEEFRNLLAPRTNEPVFARPVPVVAAVRSSRAPIWTAARASGLSDCLHCRTYSAQIVTLLAFAARVR
jgi:hypothetical protein